MSAPSVAKGEGPITRLAEGALRALDSIPYWVLAIPMRLSLAQVFWSSARTHLLNWQTTLYMFANSYQVPLLSPTFAAYFAVTLEVLTPPLLLLGLATRACALALLGMTTVIEVFVYPQAWPEHVKWVAMLLVLLARGPGAVSLDAWLRWRVWPAVLCRGGP